MRKFANDLLCAKWKRFRKELELFESNNAKVPSYFAGEKYKSEKMTFKEALSNWHDLAKQCESSDDYDGRWKGVLRKLFATLISTSVSKAFEEQPVIENELLNKLRDLHESGSTSDAKFRKPFVEGWGHANPVHALMYELQDVMWAIKPPGQHKPRTDLELDANQKRVLAYVRRNVQVLRKALNEDRKALKEFVRKHLNPRNLSRTKDDVYVPDVAKFYGQTIHAHDNALHTLEGFERMLKAGEIPDPSVKLAGMRQDVRVALIQLGLLARDRGHSHVAGLLFSVAEDPNLKALVKEFRATHEHCPNPLSKKATKGKCDGISDELRDFLRGKGVKAGLVTGYGLINELPADAHKEWLAFVSKNPTDRRFLFHVAVLVGKLVIDLTGAQFGTAYRGIFYPLSEFRKRWKKVTVYGSDPLINRTASVAGDEPYNKYAHFLTEWYTRLNNAQSGSVEEWLANAMRECLPKPNRKLFRQNPRLYGKHLERAIGLIKTEAEQEDNRRGLFTKWLRQILKVKGRFKTGKE